MTIDNQGCEAQRSHKIEKKNRDMRDFHTFQLRYIHNWQLEEMYSDKNNFIQDYA